MATNLEAVAEKIQAEIDLVQRIDSTEIPTLKAAVQQEWQLTVDDLAVQGLLFYPKHERHHDSTRIIPLERVLKTIREFEETLVEKTVLDPADIYFRNLTVKERSLVFMINGINDWKAWWELAKALWEVVTHGAAGVAKILMHTVEIAAGATIATIATKIIRHRESFAKKMRSRAFPQVQPRVRWPRRKRSRR